jgi:hypothetical protein
MKRLKRRALKKNVEIKEAINTLIMPFAELPYVNTTREENADRINAHDLFSMYTADIIKEDVVFAR